jgi:D-amino peptidase
MGSGCSRKRLALCLNPFQNSEEERMKVLIAVDMEGISGVVHWDHVDSQHKEYARFRKLMTADANAAVRGAFDAGAEEVIVSDGHGGARNILVEEIEPRARLNSGSPSPFSMVQGIDSGVDAAMFVGYHARVGSPNAILDHTWSSTCVANVWLNDRPVGEIGWNSAVCGHFGAPVIMISGDQTACAEAQEVIGPIETAVVKWASGRMAAMCLSPIVAQERIYEAARRAVERFANGQGPQPVRVEAPINATLELTTSEMADRVMLLPGARRLEGKRIGFVAADMPAAYRAFRSAVSLAKG